MIQPFADWKAFGHFLERNEVVNSHSFYASELQPGYGFAKHVTNSILENENLTADIDAESVHRYSSMLRTCRKQTKQVIISRSGEVNLCNGEYDARSS